MNRARREVGEEEEVALEEEPACKGGPKSFALFQAQTKAAPKFSCLPGAHCSAHLYTCQVVSFCDLFLARSRFFLLARACQRAVGPKSFRARSLARWSPDRKRAANCACKKLINRAQSMDTCAVCLARASAWGRASEENERGLRLSSARSGRRVHRRRRSARLRPEQLARRAQRDARNRSN